MSTLITSVLNSASDRLVISSIFSYILSGALIYSFIWAIFFLSWCSCLVRGGALGAHQGGATHVTVLWCCVWGRGPTGSNGPCLALCRLSVTSPATHKEIGPFWCWFPGGWVGVCMLWDPVGLSNKLSCESGSFSCCCLNPHRCFQSEVWGFISPCWSPGFVLCLTPQSFLLVYLYANTGPPRSPAAAFLRVLSARMPVSAPPTCLGECFFFNSLVVRLPYSSIFWQFWFFIFKCVVLLLVVQGGKVYPPMPSSWLEVHIAPIHFMWPALPGVKTKSITKQNKTNYRQILPLNINVKILNKILANWIQLCLKRTISCGHVAFMSEIKGWLNIGKSISAIHDVSRIKYKNMMIAINEGKTFDKVEQINPWENYPANYE